MHRKVMHLGLLLSACIQSTPHLCSEDVHAQKQGMCHPEIVDTKWSCVLDTLFFSVLFQFSDYIKKGDSILSSSDLKGLKKNLQLRAKISS